MPWTGNRDLLYPQELFNGFLFPFPAAFHHNQNNDIHGQVGGHREKNHSRNKCLFRNFYMNRSILSFQTPPLRRSLSFLTYILDSQPEFLFKR